MKKTISRISIVLFFAIAIFAQSEEKKLIEIDDFGTLPLGDLSARVDSLQSAYRTNKNSTALIRIYGGSESSIAFPYIRKAFYEAYFSSSNREIGKGKLTIQICDANQSEIRNRFFLVPQEVKIDKCEENSNIPSKTTLIKSDIFHPVRSADDYLGTRGVDKAATKALYDFMTELLKKSPESKIYVIGYAGIFFESVGDEEEKVSKIDSLKVNDKSLKQIKNTLIKKGIVAQRIIVMRGGHRNYSREADIWFVPKGGAIPKPKPDYFPKKKRK